MTSRSTNGRGRVGTLVVLIAGLCLSCSREALGQVVASDYMAYPKNMTLMDFMRRENIVQLSFARWAGLYADYKLGPGDELTIRVFGATVMNQNAKVSRTGMISIPLVGDVKASELTAGQLEEAIAGKLRERGLLNKPEVLVYITGYESKQIYVFGAVDRPGLYQMTQDLRIMDAIFMAGGIDPNAGNSGYLHRKVSELGPDWPKPTPAPLAAPVDSRTGNVRMPSPRDLALSPEARRLVENPEMVYPGTEVIKFDLTRARKGGVVEPNLVLRAGDIVVVSEETKRVFYVIGDVHKPAAVEIPTPAYRKVYASQAIASAGGPLPTAKTSQGVLIRVGENGQRTEFKLDFQAILKGKQPDMEVTANDVIFIPGSMSKTLAYGILGILPQQAVMSAVENK